MRYEIDSARENGIDSIAVEHGFGAFEEIRLSLPTYPADNADDLEQILLG